MDHSRIMNILMIEDNPADAQRIRGMLGDYDGDMNLGYANKLSSGLKRIDREDFDVVLLDLHLTDSRGLNTLIKTKKKANDLPIIVLLEKYDERMSKKVKEKGAEASLLKNELNATRLMQSIGYAAKKKEMNEYKKKKTSKDKKDERSVLIISPKKFSMKLLKHIVEQDHQVMGAFDDVKEGLKEMAEKEPDLVILDIDGINVDHVSKVRELETSSKIMICGTDLPEEITQKFRASGYMNKPLKKEKLLNEIDIIF